MNKQRKGDDWTPLFVAAMLGRMEVVLLLVQAGADTRLMDTEERTADMVARQYGHHMVADIINRWHYAYSFIHVWEPCSLYIFQTVK